MKNDSHPLLQALKKRGKSEESAFTLPEPDRLFQLKKEDIPAGRTFDAGDNAKFAIHGKIKSIHDDGTLMMHVHKVEHQADPEFSDAPKEPIVVTQESHTP